MIVIQQYVLYDGVDITCYGRNHESSIIIINYENEFSRACAVIELTKGEIWKEDQGDIDFI